MRNTLVTGITGFVGMALAHRLTADDVAVRGAVRREVEAKGAFEPVHVGSVNGVTDWKDALAGVDSIVHLAARAHVLDEQETNPLEAFRRVNMEGTLKLARQAAEAGVRRFVFMSSIGVNGNETARPFNEIDVPAPTEPYAVSKWEAERGLRELASKASLDLVIIRPPLVYGPGAPGNFGSLLRWVHKGVPLPLGAVTQNRRSLVGLHNLVDLIVTCLEHPGAAGETFLVSDGEDVSTAGLLRKVGDALERPARLVPVPVWILRAAATALGKREMARRLLGSLQVDASKAREVLGWVPPVSLDEGLRRAVAPLLQRGR